MSDINALVAAANAAVNQGHWDQAEHLWKKVLALDPEHAQALYSLGVHAFQRGQLGGHFLAHIGAAGSHQAFNGFLSPTGESR